MPREFRLTYKKNNSSCFVFLWYICVFCVMCTMHVTWFTCSLPSLKHNATTWEDRVGCNYTYNLNANKEHFSQISNTVYKNSNNSNIHKTLLIGSVQMAKWAKSCRHGGDTGGDMAPWTVASSSFVKNHRLWIQWNLKRTQNRLPTHTHNTHSSV